MRNSYKQDQYIMLEEMASFLHIELGEMASVLDIFPL